LFIELTGENPMRAITPSVRKYLLIPAETRADVAESLDLAACARLGFSAEDPAQQREDLRLEAAAVTHLRLTIVPNKNGSGRATLTSLHLYP
jgi:hypothetical protein